MIRCSIIDIKTNAVVNLVEYEFVPQGEVPGFGEGYIAVASETAQIGWQWDGHSFTDPNPPRPSLMIAVLDGAAFLARVTDDEYVAIKNSPNVRVQRWVELLRLRGEIDLSGSTTAAAKAGLVQLGLLTAMRADAIFAPPN